jgi:hypothetical protein
MKYEDIARVCHEANRALCTVTGDHSQVSWDEADERIKASAVDGVVRVARNPHITPEQLHESWCNFKSLDGWVYGPTKDAVAHTHPCLVPYDKLSAHQKDKDEVFYSIVRLLLPYVRES